MKLFLLPLVFIAGFLAAKLPLAEPVLAQTTPRVLHEVEIGGKKVKLGTTRTAFQNTFTGSVGKCTREDGLECSRITHSLGDFQAIDGTVVFDKQNRIQLIERGLGYLTNDELWDKIYGALANKLSNGAKLASIGLRQDVSPQNETKFLTLDFLDGHSLIISHQTSTENKTVGAIVGVEEIFQ